MASPVDDRGVDAFLRLLREGSSGPGPRSDALDALAERSIWLATWEPHAEGFRTLINTDGEEALAVFSSEGELRNAASRFGWLESDGTIATHESIGSDILRHAWTREYAFLVVDIASDHSLEYAREDLKALRDMDTTGPFRTSRPPPPSDVPGPRSSFPPPVERISTMYSMAPSRAEKLDRLSDLPTKPHGVPKESEPATEPHSKVKRSEPPPVPEAARRKSSRSPGKPKSDPPPAAKIEEVRAGAAKLGEAGTYGAASIIPPSAKRTQQAKSPSSTEADDEESARQSSSAPKLNSDAPTAPAARASDLVPPGGKLALPPIGPIGTATAQPQSPTESKPKPPEERPSRVVPPSIGDAIELVSLLHPPDGEMLKSLISVLRGYPEVEWASFCQVARPAGEPSPAVGLRVTDNYRDNVTGIIKQLCDAGRKHDLEIDVLLIDGHDLLRKARERAFVFFPWMPKPFGS